MKVHFTGGNRSADAFSLRVNSRYTDLSQTGLLLSAALVVGVEARGVIQEVASNGIKIRNKWNLFPGVFVRNYHSNDHDGVVKILLLPEQYTSIMSQFGLPSNVMEGAYFLVPGTYRRGRNYYQFMPSWEELLDPAWAGAYRRFLAEPTLANLPDPAEFSWQTLANGRLPFPGMNGSVDLSANKIQRLICGSMELQASNSHSQAIFRWGQAQQRQFELSPSGFSHLRNHQSREESHNLSKFKKLFGGRPEITEYESSLRAGADGRIRLGSIAGQSLTINFSKVFPLEPNELFYFKFSRANDSVLIECYTSPAKDKASLYGVKILSLHCGFPAQTDFSLQKQ